MNVSIIIVNYNTTAHLRKCLDSIFDFAKCLVFEVIVIDNNSIDRSIEGLPDEFKSVKFFFRSSNDGFGAGCNYGANKAVGKYFLFLNPDIVLTNNAIYEFYKFMETNADVGICSGLLTDSVGNPRYTYNFFPNISWEFREAISRTTENKIGELLNKITIADKSKMFDVDWIMGACLFIRSELFKRLKGFDESLFLYYEDVDLEYRLSKFGFKVVVLPAIKLQHHEKSSITSGDGSDVYFYNMHKSKMKYMHKHLNFFKRNIVRFLFISGMLLRIFAIPFRKNNSAYNYRQAFNVLKIYLK